LKQRGRAAGASQTRRRDGTLLRIIAVLKFLKAASLIALSVGVFRTMHQDIGMRFEHWIRAMHLDPGNRHIEMFLERVSNLSPAQVKRLGLVGLLYAGLFLVEGTGLWLQRRWGEWATVVISGLLIPVEVYEIFRHPSAAKILVLIVNMAVVGYLAYRIRTTEASV
jgi:uncharacterized membrane protein (DUF2068 family)